MADSFVADSFAPDAKPDTSKPSEKFGPARDPAPGSLGGDIAALPGRTGRLMIGRDKPKGIDDYALMTAASAPLIYAAGRTGAPVMPAWLARMGASGALAKGRGEDWYTTAVETAGAGVAEGLGGLVSQLGGRSANAMARITQIIGRGKDGPANVQGLAAKIRNWLSASTATERDALLHGAASSTAPANTAREGIVPYLEKIDPVAARLFEEEVAQGARLPRGLRAPTLSPGTSETVRDVASNPVLRSGADAAVSENRTAAGLAAEAPASWLYRLGSAPGHLLRHLY